MSTTTSVDAVLAAASVSATTSATGWPDDTISSRASGSAARPAAPADDRQVGRRQHRDDAGHAQRRLPSMRVIRACASAASTSRACSRPGTGRSAA